MKFWAINIFTFLKIRFPWNYFMVNDETRKKCLLPCTMCPRRLLTVCHIYNDMFIFKGCTCLGGLVTHLVCIGTPPGGSRWTCRGPGTTACSSAWQCAYRRCCPYMWTSRTLSSLSHPHSPHHRMYSCWSRVLDLECIPEGHPETCGLGAWSHERRGWSWSFHWSCRQIPPLGCLYFWSIDWLCRAHL